MLVKLEVYMLFLWQYKPSYYPHRIILSARVIHASHDPFSHIPEKILGGIQNSWKKKWSSLNERFSTDDDGSNKLYQFPLAWSTFQQDCKIIGIYLSSSDAIEYITHENSRASTDPPHCYNLEVLVCVYVLYYFVTNVYRITGIIRGR